MGLGSPRPPRGPTFQLCSNGDGGELYMTTHKLKEPPEKAAIIWFSGKEGPPPSFGPTPSSHRFPRHRLPLPLPEKSLDGFPDRPSKPGRLGGAWTRTQNSESTGRKLFSFSILLQGGERFNLVPSYVNLFLTLANLLPPFLF